MSERQGPARTSDAGDDGERIEDGRAGLERAKDLMRRLLKVPKSEVNEPRGRERPERK